MAKTDRVGADWSEVADKTLESLFTPFYEYDFEDDFDIADFCRDDDE